MATQLQLRRGTTSENASFTGAVGEVTVDTTKDTLIVQDGSTAGGHELAKADGTNITGVDSLENGGNTKVLATSTGIDVTGTAVANGFALENNAEYINVKNSSGASTRAFGVNGANNLYIGGIDADIGPILFVDNGVTLATLGSTGLDVTGTGTFSSSVKASDLEVEAVTPVIEINSLTSTELGTLQFTTAGEVDSKITHLAQTGAMIIDSGRNSSWGGSLALITDTFQNAKFTRTGVTFNDGGADMDFRVESDNNAHMLFVDGGSDSVGIGTSAIGTINSVAFSGVALHVKKDTLGRAVLEGSARAELILNDSGGSANQRARYVNSDGGVLSFGAYDDNGTAREHLSIANSGPITIPSTVTVGQGITADYFRNATDSTEFNLITRNNTGSALYVQKPVAGTILDVRTGNAGAGQGDAVFTVSDTAIVANDSSGDRDFRVESDSNSYMFYVDAGLDAIGIGSVLGSGYQATQQGMMQFRNGGGEGTPAGSGGIEFYSAQANSGYAHRLCAFDNSGGDTPLLLQRRNNSATWSTQMTFEGNSNNVVFAGTVSKGGGSFKIDHPLPSMNGTHHLVHSFVEGPQADNLYRGRVTLVDGQASVNLDTTSNMTEGTFVLLNRDVQCFTSNETGWTAVRGTVSGNTISIEAQDNTCTDTISWMVVGERHDQFMYDNEFADDDGHIIVEPIKKPHLQNT